MERLTIVPPERLVVTQKPGARFLRMEAWLETKQAALRLKKAFGGEVREAKIHFDPAASPPPPPLKIGRRLSVIREPLVTENSAGTIPASLVIPANLAFGTGDHATTGMCLRWLEEITRSETEPWDFIDYGCGTGILALAATRFGARQAWGIDFDPVAVRVARENARTNKIRNCRFEIADVLHWQAPSPVKFAAANLFSNLLIQALPILLRTVLPNGHLILSGILKSQADEVKLAANTAGWTVLGTRRKGKWVCILLEQSGQI